MKSKTKGIYLYQDEINHKPMKCKRCEAFFMEQRILKHHFHSVHSDGAIYKKPTISELKKKFSKKNPNANTLVNTSQNKISEKSSMTEKLHSTIKMDPHQIGKFR